MKALLYILLMTASSVVAWGQSPDLVWMRGGRELAVRGVVFRADSRTLVSATIDGTLKVWDVATGQLLGFLPRVEEGIGYMTSSPDRSRFGVVGTDGRIRLLDAETGHVVGVFPSHDLYPRFIAFSNDGRLIAGASDDGRVSIWDVERRDTIRVFSAHTFIVHSVAFSPDGTLLVSGSDDFSARVWEVGTGKHVKSIQVVQGPMVGVAFTPDGKGVLFNGKSGGRYDLATGTVSSYPVGRYCRQIVHSRDGKVVIVGMNDPNTSGGGAYAFRLDSNTSGIIGGGEGWINSLDVSPDNRWGALGNEHGDVWISETTQGTMNHPTINEGEIHGLAFSRDRNTLYSGDVAGLVRMWDVERSTPRGSFEAHAMAIHSLALSNSGTRLATASDDGTIKIWRLDTLKLEQTIYVSAEWPARAAIFSPDDMHIIGSVGENDSISLNWSIGAIDPQVRYVGHSEGVNTVAISPDGAYIATGGDDGAIIFWDVASGGIIARVDDHEGAINSVAISPDGTLLVSGSEDRTVRVWAVPSGDPIRTITGHTQAVTGVGFGPSGETYLSASRDSTVRVWARQGGAELHRYDYYPGGMTALAIADDRVASASSDASLLLWRYMTTAAVDATTGIETRLAVELTPQPAFDRASLAVDLPESSDVMASIHSITGEEASTHRIGRMEKGRHTIGVDLSSLRPGLYVVRVQAGSMVEHCKLIVGG